MAVAHRIYAEALFEAAKESGRLAQVNEAIVDFLTWAPGSDVMEFNAKAGEDGTGLIALQYAQRIKAKDMEVADFRALRQRMVNEMLHTDVEPAREYFADDSEDDPQSPE